MLAEDMRVILKNHEDFRNEKTIVKEYLTSLGHTVYFIPKFHCELNPIERVWGQAKAYTRVYTNYNYSTFTATRQPCIRYCVKRFDWEVF